MQKIAIGLGVIFIASSVFFFSFGGNTTEKQKQEIKPKKKEQTIQQVNSEPKYGPEKTVEDLLQATEKTEKHKIINKVFR